MNNFPQNIGLLWTKEKISISFLIILNYVPFGYIYTQAHLFICLLLFYMSLKFIYTIKTQSLKLESYHI